MWTQTLAVFTGTRFLRSARHNSPGLTFSPEDAEVAACVLAMMQVILSTVLATALSPACCKPHTESGLRKSHRHKPFFGLRLAVLPAYRRARRKPAPAYRKPHTESGLRKSHRHKPFFRLQ